MYETRELSTQCKICGEVARIFDEATVLRKHRVKYFHCEGCGFLQTETPYWLDEAYSTAINRLDTGILQRNISNQRIVAAVLEILFPRSTSYLDYGAGHGILVRLMRDAGYDFRWHDLHATNDYARGFEHKEGEKYDFLTCFEVLEHLVDPMAELSKLMALAPNVIASTELLPAPLPKISEWWYYGPAHGQHVSFYTSKALHAIARKFGRTVISSGSMHLFTQEPKSDFLYRLAMKPEAYKVLRRVRKRKSLTFPDHELMRKEDVDAIASAQV